MKALYFAIAVLSILAATAVNAQGYEQDYDVINKENLRNQAGFAALRGGNEVSADVMSYDNQKPQASMMAPQSAMTSAAQPMQMPNAPQQPMAETPVQPSISMQPTVTAPQQPTVEASTSANQAMPIDQTVTAETEMLDPTQLNEMQPAAGNMIEPDAMANTTSTMAASAPQPEVVMVEDGSAQTVFTTKTIIGNTDTGVNPETVLQALEGQNLN